MKLRDLVNLYQRHAERECVKHGRSTSTRHAVRAATNYLLEVVVPAQRLDGRAATAAAEPTEDRPQLNLLSHDLPGGGGPPERRLAEVSLEDLTRADLRDYLDHLLAKRHRKGKHAGQPWTAAHINSYRGIILRMFGWAEDERHCGPAVREELERCKPLRAGKTVARHSAKVTSAPEEVVFELIDWLRDTADKMRGRSTYQRDLQRKRRLLAVALELMWELGCRPQELVLMREADIVEDPRQPGGYLYLPQQWKTEHEAASGGGERRIMVVNTRAKELIEEAVVLRRTDGHQMLLASFDDYDPEGRLFTWTASHPYHAVNGMYNAVARNLKRAGLDHITPLQIRHSFATRAAAVNVEGARVQLGHRSLNTTMRYIDQDGPAVRNLFEAMAAGGGPRPSGPGTDQPPLRLVGA